MTIQKGLQYTKEHEWILIEENVATIGITDFAQESLGDITYVQLPKEGETIRKNDTFGVVESVKAVSDLYAPISGRVVEVNHPLLEAPEIINEDPYNEGWMLKVEMDEMGDREDLMSSDDYKDYVEENS
ncbi:MAG: glycine cleavage system protein GcvH [Bdellovibrionales bacterium]|nr:glycine cleavage system protein GcvH [Bdellovibrionales bacterium]